MRPARVLATRGKSDAGVRHGLPALAALAATLCLDTAPLAGQVPLGNPSGRGQTVTPAYEGWYPNADGTLSLSFGYFNRNFEETIEVPLGPDNTIEPAEFQGAQPTSFAPRRHYGVFVVRVPADFGEGKVYWTLRMRGQTFRVPGHLHRDWQIDALKGEAGDGNTPPVLRFGAGEEGAGPAGAWGGPLTARVGEALDVSVHVRDDGVGRSHFVAGSRDGSPVNLTWFKHQGPGDVAFGEPTARVPASGAEAATPVTFSEPGDYILRVRANDGSGVSAAGHAQCCWTNGFLRVTVDP
ncbi:MAG: hypothetical protein OXI39_15955 [Gemmatimonadota bacterium]|uniref:hypothetical protein n=1 Tax=Candidatus Palauibacter scopulicola TaxID=3056741 RepID=UPI0023829E22|nr:hypothetical protein [Candidatus Palauibacter scopulicola]MDE2664483.1 hypothetical protein [Candidatus Palauibacter scopulicola]